MYDTQHEQQCRGDDRGGNHGDDFADALGDHEEELGGEETYAPQVTRPGEAKRDRGRQEPDGARSGVAKVTRLGGDQVSAESKLDIGKDGRRRQHLIRPVAGVSEGGRTQKQC